LTIFSFSGRSSSSPSIPALLDKQLLGLIGVLELELVLGDLGANAAVAPGPGLGRTLRAYSSPPQWEQVETAWMG
jgi:hypothetical protein